MIIEEIEKILCPSDSFCFLDKLNKNTKNFRVVTLFKGTDKERIIFVPKKYTKYCQRFILEKYLKDLPFSSACTAYRKNTSPYKNAQLHKNNRYFLHLDIKHFFNNMQWNVFADVIKRNFSSFKINGLLENKNDVKFLKNVLCYKGRFVQGSVTSPCISNIYLYEFDNFVINYIREHNLDYIYTRYSDDIYISSKNYINNEIVDILDGELKKHKLRLNFQKIKFSKVKNTVKITGLSVKKTKTIVVPTAFKKKAKKTIYEFLIGRSTDKKIVLGQLSYLKSNEQNYYLFLCNKYVNGKDLIDIVKNDIKIEKYSKIVDISE